MKTNAAKTLTFRSILASYILVCAILLGITGIGYMGLLVRFEQEQERLADLQMRGLSLNVSKNIQQTYQIFDILEGTDEFWEFAAIEGEWKTEEILRGMELRAVMEGLDSKNELYRNLHIYFCRSNSILSSKTQRREGDQDITFFCKEYGLEKAEFDAMLSMENGRYYAVIGSEKIWFFQPVYDGTKLLAVIFAEFDGNLLIDSNEQENIILLHTQEGNNLLCAGSLSKEEIAGFIAKEDKKEGNQIRKIAVAGKTYIGIRAYINLFNMELYMLLPETIYLSQTRSLLVVLLLELLLMAVCAVLLSWFLSKKMYIPVGNLIRDNRNLSGRIMKNKRIWENIELVRYLDGMRDTFPAACIGVKEKLYGEEGEENYQMAVIVPNHGRDGFEFFHKKEGEEENLLWNIIFDILEEQVFCEYPGVALPMEKQYIAIVQMKTSDAENADRLKYLFEHASQTFSDYLKMPVCIMIGKRESGFEGMKKVYDDLSEGLQYLDFWNADGERKEGVYVYGEMIQNEEGMNFSDYINGSRRLFNCLERQDFRGAERELDTLYKKTFSKNHKYLKYNIYRMYGLIGILVTMLNASADEEEQKFYQSLNYEERLFRIQSLHELIAESHAVFEKMLRYKESRTSEKKPEWLEKMTEFITVHYADTDLNVSTLADQFRISVPYLSRSFKNWMGVGALEYIHRVKIEHSKEMLKNDCSVKIAASAVGYLDVQAYTRAFKRYEGITPSQYKEQILKNEAE